MSKSFSQSAAKIAKSNRPWCVVFNYATSTHEQGELVSTHSTCDLANKAARSNGFDTFLAVRDARDYA